MVLTLIFLGACATKPTNPPLIDAVAAGAEKAVAEAGVDLPPLPHPCYVDTPHAPLVKGRDAIITLRKERGQLDAANSKRYECAKFYNDLKDGLAPDADEGKKVDDD